MSYSYGSNSGMWFKSKPTFLFFRNNISALQYYIFDFITIFAQWHYAFSKYYNNIMRNKFIVLCAMLFSVLHFNAYAQMAVGQWRTHFAYNFVEQIAQTEHKVFAVSEGALFSVDKEDEGMEFYSKVNGLSDANIVKISYDSKLKKLIIAYANGNIDIMTSGGVENVPDLNLKQLNAGKRIYHMYHYNDFVYLSTDFGVVLLNVKRNEIADTYIVGNNSTDVKIIATAIHDGLIYALGETAIYRADANSKQLVDFSQWTPITQLPGQGLLKNIGVVGNHLVLHQNNQVFRLMPNGSWERFMTNIENAARTFFRDNNLLIYDNGSQLFKVDAQLNHTFTTVQNQVFDVSFDNISNTYWMAGNEKGVVSYSIETAQSKTYVPNGPAVNSPFKIDISDDRVIVVPGSAWDINKMYAARIMIYEKVDGVYVWKNILIQDEIPNVEIYLYDIVDIIINPKDKKHFFAGSFGNGLFEFRDDKFYKWHNHTNSTLETILPHNPLNYIRVDGFAFDSEGNLFMTNSYVGNYLQMLKPDGSWKGFDYPKKVFTNFSSVVIPKAVPNQKWIASRRNSTGIIVTDNKGTLENMSDDGYKFMSSFVDADKGGYITPKDMSALVEDKNGVIWVGTNEGPLLFFNPSRAFEDNYTCSRVKIAREDGTELADYLLETERVTAIAVDGANRKWLGTEGSGLYLVSENGQNIIKHFTTVNSALLSNNILDIAINERNGEVFVGTSAGLISYRGDASEAGDTFGEVYAFPNPVRENYKGVITITGLVAKTHVKITDVAGNLVFETISNGGMATWDGKDKMGRKVSTGVYMAICVNEDGTLSTITKIMVIN